MVLALEYQEGKLNAHQRRLAGRKEFMGKSDKGKAGFWDKLSRVMMGFGLLLAVFTGCWRVWEMVSPDAAPGCLLFSYEQWTALATLLLVGSLVMKRKLLEDTKNGE